MKYDFEMELNQNTSVGKIVAYIKDSSKVLEFGPGNGRMTDYLINEKKCEVSIVELDKELYDFVSEFSTDAFYGNIEDYTWCDYYEGQKFDYIIFADVLEHLMSPKKTLEAVKEFLNDEGVILITFPNIAHNSVLIELFNNKLEWRETGLLDATHKSFYTQSGFEKLFSKCGLFIETEDYTQNEVGYNEIHSSYEDLPTDVRYSFKNRPFGEVYQYFFALKKKKVQNPTRQLPDNSHYHHLIRMMLITDEEEKEMNYELNVQTRENENYTLKLPDDFQCLKLFPSLVGAVVSLKAVSDNQEIFPTATNAIFVQDGIYFFNDTEVPVIEFCNSKIAGNQISIEIDFIYEGTYSEMMKRLIDFSIEKRDEAYVAEKQLSTKVATVEENLKQAKNDLSDAENKIEHIEYSYKSAMENSKNLKSFKRAIRVTDTEVLEKELNMVIDDITRHPERQTVIIRGWGFDQATKNPLSLSVPFLEALFSQQESEYRRDVIEAFDLDGKKDYGFSLEIKDLISQPEFHLMIETQDGREYCRIVEIFYDSSLTLPQRISKSLQHRGVFGSIKHMIKRQQMNQPEKFDETQILADIESFTYKPKISVVVPVYNVEEKWLEACVSSLENQYYTNWELCLADDASPSEHVKPLLQKYSEKNDKIKVIYREENGHISEATNSALSIATGDFIGFMDNDDELVPVALYEIVKALNQEPEIDFFYTDEDKVTESGKSFNPFYKSNWNSELLLSHNYITHFVVIKKELLSQVGMLKTEYNGAQDYDFVLRATEKAKKIKHIPGIMYHWRAIESSTALNPGSKNYAYIAGQKALESTLKRRGLRGTVEIGEYYGSYKITYDHEEKEPFVSFLIIGLSQDAKTEQINTSLDKLRAKTKYKCYEIILPKKYADKIENQQFVTFVETEDYDQQIEKAKGKFILAYDLRVIPTNNKWLMEMLNFAQLHDVGAVAPRIVDSENKILNIGISINLSKEKLVYPEQGSPSQTLGYYYRIALPRNVQAAGINGLLFRKNDYLKVGGIDWNIGPVYAGINLCLKLTNQLNKRIVYCSYSILKNEQQMPKLPVDYHPLLDNWTEDQLGDPYLNPKHT